MLQSLHNLRKHLLTGVSFAIPFIACGGILIAAATALAPKTGGVADFTHAPKLKLISDVGAASFTLMLPVLAGYIAYSIAGKPGLVPGFVGGFFSGQVNAGYLGAILAGLLSGYLVQLIKTLPVSKHVRPIMPILIIPAVSSGVIGILMLKVVGSPIAHMMSIASAALRGLSTGNAVILAMVLGAMIAFDMGGPINKTAFFFGAAMIREGDYRIMGACAAAICTPPLGMGLATLLRRTIWSQEEQEAGVAGLAMGLTGITEGAIPFAAADPLRVIPCIILGSMTASVIAMLGGVGDHAPHGGPIVLPVVDRRIVYLAAIIVGTIVTALSINLLKTWSQKPARDMERVA
ncbi:MAG: PTS fructose transporter subunit IIC [Acidobacteria bacterium]|nr:PTS fructose transporter subunit IIC [Acidobacteriota bacterium]